MAIIASLDIRVGGTEERKEPKQKTLNIIRNPIDAVDADTK